MELNDNEGDLIHYRSVSRAAMLALLLGLLSSLALVNTLLWALPVVAIAVSLLAMRNLSTHSTELVGRSAAIVGLAAAIFFGAWAPARDISRSWLLQSQAKPLTDEFIDLFLSGKLHEAHQLTLRPIQRQSRGTSLAAFYENSDTAREQLKEFLAPEAPQILLSLGNGAKVDSSRSSGINFQVNWHVGRQYTISNFQNKESVTINVVALRRTAKNTDHVTWEIVGLGIPPE